jgi:hypothetical protein
VQPTTTREQAVGRAVAIVQEAHAALPPGAELELQSEGTLPCDDPDDHGPAGRVFVEKVYQLIFSESWPVEQALPRLAGFWASQGYRIITDRRGAPDPFLSVENGVDGFRVGIEVFPRDAGKVDVYLFGSSPCVWETGTPDPR